MLQLGRRTSCNIGYGLGGVIALSIPRLELVAVGAEELALGHLGVEDVLDSSPHTLSSFVAYESLCV